MISKLASPDLRRSRTLQLKQLYSTDWHVENVRRLPGRSRLRDTAPTALPQVSTPSASRLRSALTSLLAARRILRMPLFRSTRITSDAFAATKVTLKAIQASTDAVAPAR
jgi:hypothetical protein